jgi:hypothetical protein
MGFTLPSDTDKSSVTFFEFFFSPRSTGRWRSWWSLTMTFPLVVGLVVGLYDSRRDAAIGARQESTSGQVIAYEPNNHNSYRYTFTAQGRQFSGISESPRVSETVGAPTPIYFDPLDPRKNSLEDFSMRSHRDRGLVPICTFGICVIPAIILYSKLRVHRRT